MQIRVHVFPGKYHTYSISDISEDEMSIVKGALETNEMFGSFDSDEQVHLNDLLLTKISCVI